MGADGFEERCVAGGFCDEDPAPAGLEPCESRNGEGSGRNVMPARRIGVVFADEIKAAALRRQVFEPGANESTAGASEFFCREGFARIDGDDVVALAGKAQGVRELVASFGAYEEDALWDR